MASALPAGAVSGLERQGLIAIYESTGGPGWARRTNWLGPAGTECTWAGVACNGDESQVIGLDLQSNNLTGRLPAAIGNLANLYTLHLANNALTGSAAASLRRSAACRCCASCSWNATRSPARSRRPSST